MEWIIALILGILGIGGSLAGNVLNSDSVDRTNAINRKSQQDINAANTEQANLAYNRSLPVNQVRNLMDAGYSKAGALSAISGAGTYSAPVLGAPNAQAKQFDFSGMQASLDRLGSIPANAEQLNMQRDQRKLVQQQYEHNLNEERRKQELHQYEMWQRMYGKNIATITDKFNSYISAYAAAHNVDLSSITSKDSFIKAFDLKNNKDWHNMPKVVQDKFYQDALTQARENRDIQTQNNVNRAANDAHVKALDDLKNSEFGRTLTAKQIAKVDEETKMLSAQYGEYLEDMPARDKERKVREGSATLQSLLNSMEINKNEFLKAIRFDENGNPSLSEERAISANETSRKINDVWKMLLSFVGIDYLGDIIRSISLIK